MIFTHNLARHRNDESRMNWRKWFVAAIVVFAAIVTVGGVEIVNIVSTLDKALSEFRHEQVVNHVNRLADQRRTDKAVAQNKAELAQIIGCLHNKHNNTFAKLLACFDNVIGSPAASKPTHKPSASPTSTHVGTGRHGVVVSHNPSVRGTIVRHAPGKIAHPVPSGSTKHVPAPAPAPAPVPAVHVTVCVPVPGMPCISVS